MAESMVRNEAGRYAGGMGSCSGIVGLPWGKALFDVGYSETFVNSYK
ncbi:hypothetical protein C8J33_106208 [Rhizobium sp. PP-CC-3G-465]|nr:hypothetical protein C8J33_106208 [Rhizobium sp. PP-CC-3G-465]